MPKTAHKPKTQPQHYHPSGKPKRKRNAALLMAIFIGLVGLTIAAFSSAANMMWMAGSTAVGAVAGALIGHAIDKSIEK